MAQAKIELKLGQLHFTGEADAAWLETQLDKVLAHVKAIDLDEPSNKSVDGAGAKAKKNKHIQATTATIAARLQCKVGVGKDVVTAAAAKLEFVDSKQTFTRAELLSAAKEATSYYKSTVAANLTNTLSGLVKSGDFIEVSKGNYSFSATKKDELEVRLAS